MLEEQIQLALSSLQERACTIKGVAITVIEFDGSVSTSLNFMTDQAMAMLGAVELAKDQIKAGLSFGAHPDTQV